MMHFIGSILTLLSIPCLSKPSLGTEQDAKLLKSNQAQRHKPNIVFIMADDLGWGNVGYHNKENPEVQTPHIDYLVTHGLQLNRHYVDAECSPTRTSFQSGRLPVHGNENNNDGITDPTMGVHPDMTCIADKLKEAGYSTHMVGKWDSGFASFRQIPVNRGYDTSYGYLGKSIDYFTKKGDGVCSQTYVDLWENYGPAKQDVKDINLNEYSEDVFAKKVLTKIDEMADLADNEGHRVPFFLFYASHLPHYPAQLPTTCIDDGFYKDFKDDETQCSEGNSQIFPGYYEDTSDWSCRAILQAQVAVLDSIVGDITASLKEHNMWEDTLIIFTSDNGGSLELESTAGNNYPLRGGKASFLEGGIRATAFVSGGYLPQTRRGQIEEGMMHIADWYVTFSEMLGIEASDTFAVSKGLPDVDGYNMWPLIVGEVDESPRSELIMNKNTFFYGEYKIITGSTTKYAIWQSAIFPNASSPTQDELEATTLNCMTHKKWGCLFNVVDDPSEYNDLSEDQPKLLAFLREKLENEKDNFYSSDFYGENGCPERFDEVAQDYVSVDLEQDSSVDACGCWMSIHNWNFFAGPYQDLDDDQIYYDKPTANLMIDRVVDQQQQDNFVSYVVYYALIIATVILLFVSIRHCQHTANTQQIPISTSSKTAANYGAL